MLVGIEHVDLTCKDLILAATGARWKYNLYLEELKKKTEVEQSGKKRKAVCDQIEEARLQQDISSLEASADALLTNTLFTRYNRLLNRLYNQFDNRLYRVNKHPTGC